MTGGFVYIISIPKMKNKRFSPLFVLMLFVAQITFAQQFAFKVLVSKGKNEVKSGGSWQPIKVGAQLQKNDEIRLSPNAYLGLMHNEGKPLELKEAGAHKVSKLEENLQKGGSSVVAKYTDYILSSNNSANTLKATGAVHRGPENIEVFLPTAPSFTVVYGDEVILSWNKLDMKGPFDVTLSNPFGDILKEMKTETNSVTINLADRDFQHEDNIMIKVFSKSDNKVSPDQLMVKRLSKADKERMKKQLDEIAATTSEETALNNLVRAGFFESQNLLIDAATAYQKAAMLAPDVPEYQTYFESFLVRTGLKTK